MNIFVALFFLVSFFEVHGVFRSSTDSPTPSSIHDMDANATFVVTKWLKLPLDHFSKEENSTMWKMRYTVHDHFFKKNGPIFLSIGAEGRLSPLGLTRGHMINIGRSLGAYFVGNEHRFYGESRPKKDLSPENMKYLTVEQTLADIAQLIRFLKKDKRLANSPVVAYGGSYAGNLCLWGKLTYPDLIDAAVASSAPIHVVTDFYGYLEIVNNVLATEGSQECVDVIQQGIKNIEDLLKTPNGVKKVSEMFNASKLINTKNPLDVQTFFFDIIFIFAKTVQYSGDVTTIQSACRYLVDDLKGSPESRIAGFIYKSEQKSIVRDYDDVVKKMQNTSYEAGSTWGFPNAFYYQKCSEFAKFYTTTSKKQPFGNNTPITFFVDHLCPDVFGKQFNATLITDRVKYFTEKYGGLKPNVTKVLFVNGSLDPWHGLSITKSLSDEVPAIFIHGTSHGSDMGSASPQDSKQLAAAKKKIATIVTKWVKEISQ